MSKRVLNHWFLWAAVTGAACAMDVSGCGGSSGTGPAGGGSDASSVDATGDGNIASDDSGNVVDSEAPDAANGMDGTSSGSGDGSSDGNPDSASASDANDSGSVPDTGTPPDSGSEGGSACVTGSACTNGSGNGVCAGGTCGACASGGTSVGPDSGCTTAYGSGTTQYVCSAGSCIPGNCNASTDCTTAGSPTCGFATPNVCGGCSSDSQCAAGKVCDTTSSSASYGTCVAAATGCSAATSNVACTVNASDVCCAGSCVPGNCCYATVDTVGTNYCKTIGIGNNVTCAPTSSGETVGGGICSKCAGVSGLTYVVDPFQGDDGTGTGSTTTAATCAFKSIARALQVIGPSPAVGTQIALINTGGAGTVSSVAAGGAEKFPIVLPTNVKLTTTGNAAIAIDVPAATQQNATIGIILAGNPSAIAGAAGAPLTIDGQTKTAAHGVVVQSAGATLSNVVVKNFALDGVAVANVGNTASALTVQAGVQLNGNGHDGLVIGGTSTATITGLVAAPTTFNGNGQHGINVSGNAAITVNGAIGATPPNGSTVIASGNTLAGVWIQQTPGSSANSKLTGIVCTAGGANGLRIVPGSNVTVRSSWFLGNSSGSGIDIENTQGGGSTAIGNIDLGSATQAGNNVLQDIPGGRVNGGAGICLNMPKADVVLAARGNAFGGAVGNATPINCAAGPAVLHVTAAFACDHTDVGGNNIVAFPVVGTTTSNAIDVTQCTY